MENFFTYKNKRWMWINLLFLCLLAALYCWDLPVGGRSGNSWLGWIYGFIAAGGIIYLMWFGIRKRSYYSTNGTVQGWLAAHVWLGLSLGIIVPLHCAFSFGLNVHTLAYVLMLIVLVSGIYGAVTYVSIAPTLRAHRGGGTTKELLSSLQDVERELNELTGSASSSLKQLRNISDFECKPTVWSCRRGKLVPDVERVKEAAQLASITGAEHEVGLKILSLITKKRQLASQLQADVAAMSRLQLWLYLHLPVSFALLAALLIHIFVVFWYR